MVSLKVSSRVPKALDAPSSRLGQVNCGTLEILSGSMVVRPGVALTLFGGTISANIAGNTFVTVRTASYP